MKGIHHVGVAVLDLDASIELYVRAFGAVLAGRRASDLEGLEAALVRMGSSEIELMSPTRDDSPVGKFMARRGPGLHHVAYGVADIRQALDDARAAGLELIDTEPRLGMHGSLIAFVHPKSVGGVLTEFVQV